MRIQNALGLPEAIVRAVTNDNYARGAANRTVTELISPARQVALMRRHADELVEDVADRIFMLIGQAVHEILRRADMEALTEQRLSMPVLGWEVSGQFDRLVFTPAAKLSDYKATAVRAVQDGPKAEHEQQLNLYAHLLRHHGFHVEELEVVAILRDWRKREAERDASYPQQQVLVLPVRLWSDMEAQLFLEERVLAHQAAEAGELPRCTATERWQRPDTWAVMKEGRKSAVRVFYTEEEAARFVNDWMDPWMTVERRPGESIRCNSYCVVAPFCTQKREQEA